MGFGEQGGGGEGGSESETSGGHRVRCVGPGVPRAGERIGESGSSRTLHSCVTHWGNGGWIRGPQHAARGLHHWQAASRAWDRPRLYIPTSLILPPP